MSLAGTRTLIAYDSGIELDVEYLSDTELEWKGTAGPAAGKSGTESLSVIELAPGIYVVGWIEADGTAVTNVISVEAGAVVAHVTFDTPQGRRSALQRGAFTPA